MDVILSAPLPVVDPGDLLERLNGRKVSPLVLAYARQYATPGRKAQAWGKAELEQIRRDLATYPFFGYLCAALTSRVVTVGTHPRHRDPKPAPMRGLISDKDAAPYRSALDWLALAGLVQAGIRLGICPVCNTFFVDAKRRGKKVCSATCGNRERARTHYETLKAKPRKYRAHLKTQRDLMRARRADGRA